MPIVRCRDLALTASLFGHSPHQAWALQKGTTMRETSTDNPDQSYLSCARQRLTGQIPRLAQELLIRQARAVRSLARERPLTVNVGTALRSYYADVLKEPLPPELARLARALQDRVG